MTFKTFEEAAAFKPHYERWRHGGWYVTNVRYPSGAVGCVSNNYHDKKWRIACTDNNLALTFSTRDDAAKAEYILAAMTQPKPAAQTNETIAKAAGYRLNFVQDGGATSDITIGTHPG